MFDNKPPENDASVAYGWSRSATVMRDVLIKRALAGSHHSSGLMAIESRAFKATLFTTGLNSVSRMSSRGQSGAVTCCT